MGPIRRKLSLFLVFEGRGEASFRGAIVTILPDYDALVLESSFHGNERVLGSGINMRRKLGGVSGLIVHVYVMFSIDWVQLVRIYCYQDHADTRLVKN